MSPMLTASWPMLYHTSPRLSSVAIASARSKHVRVMSYCARADKRSATTPLHTCEQASARAMHLARIQAAQAHVVPQLGAGHAHLDEAAVQPQRQLRLVVIKVETGLARAMGPLSTATAERRVSNAR
jgi:hypothetical protein